ncbi:MAG: hypothetical protein H8E26_12055 [FCB group bacterium]|nr:hypothetical protein [FCB group bacterium]MBL7027010.1 hypothetical protein [Candidatus Neomarinimicrobiota bacterium]MBL7122190.1 hypothetical protein [Candidatus Neomarinimicrobiota bacterium]
MRLIQKIWITTLLVWSFSFLSCDAINPTSEGDLTDYTCEGCHTNRSTLDDVIETLNLEPPDEGPEAPG